VAVVQVGLERGKGGREKRGGREDV